MENVLQALPGLRKARTKITHAGLDIFGLIVGDKSLLNVLHHMNGTKCRLLMSELKTVVGLQHPRVLHGKTIPFLL